MKKLLFMMLCCSFFVIGCNNISDEEFDEFEFDEFEESDNINNEEDMSIVNEIDKLIFSNNFDEAKKLCDKLIKDSKDTSYYAHAHRGRIYSAEKKYLEAIDDYKKAIELAKDKSEDWFFMGVALAEQDAGGYDEKEILTYLDKAEENGISNSLLYERKARAEETLGDIESAKKNYEKALTLAKNNDEIENIKKHLEQIKNK